MTTVCTRTIAILMIGIAVSLVGSSVPAESITVYHTDFSDTTTGEVPAGWTVVDAYGTWEVDDNDELTLSAVSDDSSIVCDAAGVLTDFTVSATFHNGAGRAGLVGRLQDADNYYVLRVAGTTYLDLYWIGANDAYERMKHVALDPDYVYGEMCTMSLTFEGSTISGEIRNASDVVMGSFTDEDTRIASGKAGVRANALSFGCAEFTITAPAPIPEPGAVALLISALAGLLVVRRKR
ncbi:MAG TPA: hypothetical protein DD670_04085 [Planctomycetaceae bacterium]|nr:hypothetical protein [Planctomycetaceae bacterium]